MTRQPPSSSPFPYTTLFRSDVLALLVVRPGNGARDPVLLQIVDDHLRSPDLVPVDLLLDDLQNHDQEAIERIGNHSADVRPRSEEHTSELQSLTISYAVFCL